MSEEKVKYMGQSHDMTPEQDLARHQRWLAERNEDIVELKEENKSLKEKLKIYESVNIGVDVGDSGEAGLFIGVVHNKLVYAVSSQTLLPGDEKCIKLKDAISLANETDFKTLAEFMEEEE